MPRRVRRQNGRLSGPVPIVELPLRRRVAEHVKQGGPVVDLVIATLASATASIVLVFLGAQAVFSILIAIAAAITAWVLLRFLRSISFLPLFRIIYSLNKHFTAGNRQFFQQMATGVLQDTAKQIEQLAAGVYQPADVGDLQRYVEYCFARMTGEHSVYIGVDSNLPSEYMEDYQWFLDAHVEKLDRINPRNEQGYRANCEDRRVVIARMGDLTNQFNDNQDTYKEFIQWHKRNQVDLLHVEPDDALKRAPREGQTLDIAYWGSLVGAFKLGATATGVKLWFLDAEDYERYAKYVNSLVKIAGPFPESPTGLRLVSPELAQKWFGYIGLEHRSSTLGPFLRNVFSDLKDGGGIILDAAAGVGSETVDLLKHDFTVVPNEVDGELKKQLEAYAAREALKVNVLPYPWDHLTERMENRLRFDAVLVVGNSLCMVTGTEHRKGSELRRECVSNFRRVLRSDGRLVVDERNFQFMLDNAEEILRDPYEAFPPARKGDVLYRGAQLRGFPAEIAEDRVLWRFFGHPDGVLDTADLRKCVVVDEEGILLHPFKVGELYQLLEECGFSIESVFGDLEPVDWRGGASYPTRADGSPYDFFTYVARRTGAPKKSRNGSLA